MKIITFNCFLTPWSLDRNKRLPFIFSALLKENPDIIFLQEVFLKKDATYLVEKFNKIGFRESIHSKDLLFLSKYPIISCEQRKLNNWVHFFSLSTVERLLKDVYQIIKVKVNNETITCINLHLLEPYRDTSIYQKTRAGQITEICENVSTEQNKIVMAGDFNFGMHTSPYEIVTEHFNFTDPLNHITASTFSMSNSNIQKSTFVQNLVPKVIGQRIDHIFIRGFDQKKTSGEIVFTDKYVIGGENRNISDHYGLMLDID